MTDEQSKKLEELTKLQADTKAEIEKVKAIKDGAKVPDPIQDEKLQKMINDQVAHQIDIQEIKRQEAAENQEFDFFQTSPFGEDEKLTEEIASKRADLVIASAVLGKPIHQLKMFKDMAGKVGARALRKAMDTAEAINGADWFQTGFANTVIEMVTAGNVILPNIPTFTLPHNPYKSAVQVNNVVVYNMPEATSDASSTYTASDAGTSAVTWTASKLAALVYSSEELEEDAIIASTIAEIRNAIINGLSETAAKAIMRGDEATGASANINNASSTPDSNSYYLAMDGMAKLCIDGDGGLTRDIATLTAEDITGTATLLGKYARKPIDAPILVDRSTYYKMMLMVDANSNLVVTTLEKFGPGAPVLSGQLGAVFGFPILVTDNFVLTDNGSGGEIADLNEAVGTKGGYFHFYRPGARWGWARNITIETEKNIKTGQYAIVGTLRADIQFPHGTASVAMGYDVD